MTEIESILKLSPIFKEGYDLAVQKGKENLSGKSVVFSMLCRNGEDLILKNIDTLKSLVKPYVKDYKFVIYENDSTDNTKEILKSIMVQDPNVHCTITNHNRKFYGQTKEKERTTALAEYRNYNLEYIRSNYSDYDYVIVCDSDFADVGQQGFYNSFGFFEHEGISAICGNSYQLTEKNKLWNYDSWAYRHISWVDLSIVELPTIDNWNGYWFGFWVMPRGVPPFFVKSAFGGMGIYRTRQYLSGKYEGYDCEHVTFHYSLAQNKNFNLVLNPSQVMLMNNKNNI